VTVGASFGLAVTAEDSFGNVALSFQDSVKLALSGNPGDATLGGTLTATGGQGVATFSGLTLDQLGTGYGLTGHCRRPERRDHRRVRRGGPRRRHPAGGDHAAPGHGQRGKPLRLGGQAEDSLGNVDIAFNGTVTVADFDGNPLGGTLTATAVKGVPPSPDSR